MGESFRNIIFHDHPGASTVLNPALTDINDEVETWPTANAEKLHCLMMKIVCGFNPCLRCLIRTQDGIYGKFLSVSPLVIRHFLSSVSHYEVLNVPKNASQDDIKKAFFEKSKKYHPDVSPGNPHHHKLFVKLNNAYSVLSNISKRRDYDRSLLKPKSTTYHYQSNENLYKYKDSSFYYDSDSRYGFQSSSYSAPKRPKNHIVALVVIMFMSCGVAARLLWLWYGHRRHKRQLDHKSMKATKLYQESRERSSKYGAKKQMEMLAEKQGKTTKKKS